MNIYNFSLYNDHLYETFKAVKTQVSRVVEVALKILENLGRVLSSTIRRFAFSAHSNTVQRETNLAPANLGLGSLEEVEQRAEEEMVLTLEDRYKDHPALDPKDSEPFDNVPVDITKLIFSYLPPKDLRSTSLTCPLWNNLSSEFIEIHSEKEAKERLGEEVAEIFRENYGSWRALMNELTKKFTPSSYELIYGSYKMRYSQIEDEETKVKLSILKDSIRESDEKKLIEVLEYIKQINTFKYLNTFENPLVAAIRCRQLQYVPILIEHGAKDYAYSYEYKINTSTDNINGMSALYYAASYQDIDLVKFLLDKGARSNLILEGAGKDLPLIPTLILNSPADKEKRKKFLICLLLLLKGLDDSERAQYIKNDSLTEAIISRQSDVANVLYAMGAHVDIDDFDTIVKRCIITSCEENDVNMLKFIHQRSIKALKFLKDDSGATILHTAFSFGAFEALEYLKNQVGIPQDVRNNDGETYEVSGKKALKENLIFNITNQGTRANLHTPSFWYHTNIYEICKKQGIDLNESINNKNQTLLHLAAKSYLKYDNCLHCIKTLLDCGLKVNQRDADGNTPLDIAKRTYQNTEWYNEEYRQIALRNIQLLEQHLAKEN
ncbi:MAG: hypothetical protein Tsb0033_29050 [Winogradskyella sp.]